MRRTRDADPRFGDIKLTTIAIAVAISLCLPLVIFLVTQSLAPREFVSAGLPQDRATVQSASLAPGNTRDSRATGSGSRNGVASN